MGAVLRQTEPPVPPGGRDLRGERGRGQLTDDLFHRDVAGQVPEGAVQLLFLERVAQKTVEGQMEQGAGRQVLLLFEELQQSDRTIIQGAAVGGQGGGQLLCRGGGQLLQRPGEKPQVGHQAAASQGQHLGGQG